MGDQWLCMCGFMKSTVRAPTSQIFDLKNMVTDPVRGLLDRCCLYMLCKKRGASGCSGWVWWVGVVGGLHNQLAHRGYKRTSLLTMEYFCLRFPNYYGEVDDGDSQHAQYTRLMPNMLEVMTTNI